MAAPLQNRVTPLGELIADPARGLVYGNRGCLHDASRRVRRHHNGRRWIACRLRFRDWHRSPMMQPGRFTELFFLDEATAFAAGHRPCALCRRADYNALLEHWRVGHAGHVTADSVDHALHEERLTDAGLQRHHRAPFAQLPDGAMVLHERSARLVRGDELLTWTPAGYVAPIRRPLIGSATVLTPPLLVGVLRGGWDPAVPLVHPSALR